jgi:hypothetical protein
MAFETSPLEVAKQAQDKIIDPRDKKKIPQEKNYYQWWLAKDDIELCAQVLSTTAFLKNYHSARIRQASLYSRLYSGKPLYNYLASTSTLDNSQQMPMGRPTANVVYQCADTLTSMITQDKPQPVFLTDGGDYKEQKIAKEMNDFIMGEFYRCETYKKGAQIFRDCTILADGLIKLVRKDDKICHERTIATELLVDFNDAYYGDPRGLIHTKMCDRGILANELPEAESKIMIAQGGTVDSSPQSTDTVTDQLIVSEAWHLPSGEKSKDGRHVIICSEGVLLDEPWDHPFFPFEKLGYNENTVGWFSQGLAEILFPTQMEIYKMLIIASQCIEMTGVPKIVISELSKVLETAFNNNISTIIKTKTMAEAPVFINPTSNNPEIYQYIDWLIANAKNMSGLSDQSTSGEVTRGVESGEAQRTQQDIQAQRFAALQRRYQSFYVGLAYKHIAMCADVAKETGSYSTVYPGRDGTREVELPKMMKELKNTYIVKCFDESSLPKDPVGRQSKLSEMLAAGEITIQEFRRMSRFPDLEQSDRLAVALEERILHDLDLIIDDGEYSPPDEFMLDPLDMGTKITVQTINKYAVTNLEDEKMKMLYDYFTQFQVLKSKAQAAMAPPPQPQAPLPVAPPQASNSPTSNVQV